MLIGFLSSAMIFIIFRILEKKCVFENKGNLSADITPASHLDDDADQSGLDESASVERDHLERERRESQ